MFDYVPGELRDKVRQHRVIATDIARLEVLAEVLGQGYETVAWFDADFMIFDPDNFDLPATPYAVGREVWVQAGSNGKKKVYRKVHNAFLMFRRGNSFIDFYRETAARMLSLNTGSMPPQFIGPKLLTAIHNAVQLPVYEKAGMLSPGVIMDLLSGRGSSLDLFNARSSEVPAGANLCSSSCERQEVTPQQMSQLADILRQHGGRLFDI
jgi:hypothetical protein